MTTRLVDSLATTDALAEVFSDRSFLQAMLDFEAALALAQAAAGAIPARAADVIRSVRAEDLDPASIARDARESGTIAIPFVKALTNRVRETDESAARFVHAGPTSQDVADSAMVLTLARAKPILASDHQRLDRTLRQLSDLHARTVMLGRTLLQPAPPITFGLKIAGWVAALGRGWKRLDNAFDEALVVQLGGASGTLAAFGDRGLEIARGAADALGLTCPAAPWHTHRDRIAALVAHAGIYTATLGKIARDVSLLMQDEIGEAAEPGGESSSMPHKRNPAGCAVALAAATRLPGLVSAYLSGMVQEHERAVGGWHAEWPTIAAVVQSTGAALAAMAGVAEELKVYPDRMQSNIERTNGAIFAERVMTLLVPGTDKELARRLVTQALEKSRVTGSRFRDVLSATPEIALAIPRDALERIDVPGEYLGAAEALRLRLLSQSS